jgi:hypothetical protein
MASAAPAATRARVCPARGWVVPRRNGSTRGKERQMADKKARNVTSDEERLGHLAEAISAAV